MPKLLLRVKVRCEQFNGVTELLDGILDFVSADGVVIAGGPSDHDRALNESQGGKAQVQDASRIERAAVASFVYAIQHIVFALERGVVAHKRVPGIGPSLRGSRTRNTMVVIYITYFSTHTKRAVSIQMGKGTQS